MEVCTIAQLRCRRLLVYHLKEVLWRHWLERGDERHHAGHLVRVWVLRVQKLGHKHVCRSIVETNLAARCDALHFKASFCVVFLFQNCILGQAKMRDGVGRVHSRSATELVHKIVCFYCAFLVWIER